MTNYQPRLPYFPCQKLELENHLNETGRGAFWDPGTGKTKFIIDSACQLWFRDELNGVLVIAPNGVHSNWEIEEIPKHAVRRFDVHEPLVEDEDGKAQILREHHVYTHHSTKKLNDSTIHNLMHFRSGISWLLMSYESLLTVRGMELAKRFLKARKCMFVLDESTRIKNKDAEVTKAILKELAGLARWRRILNGTPHPNSPLDVYSQIRFLDKPFWGRHGFNSYISFRAHFAHLAEIPGPNGYSIRVVRGYKNLDQLSELIDKVSSYAQKEGLPEKIYKKLSFELTPKQRKLYDTLRDELLVEAEGKILTVTHAMTMRMRLQQIACNYLPLMDEETGETEVTQIEKRNPRLALLKEYTKDYEGSGIIWCRYTADVDQLMEHFGDKAYRLDGQVNQADRVIAREGFQKGLKQWIIAHPVCAGRGYTLHRGKLVIYYSNSDNLEHRIQSEERTHRMGMSGRSCTYIDIQAIDTVDTKIISNLRNKKTISDTVARFSPSEWI
jgi:hypothetical protein